MGWLLSTVPMSDYWCVLMCDIYWVLFQSNVRVLVCSYVGCMFCSTDGTWCYHELCQVMSAI